jgi:hypothetical protein
MPLPWTIDSRAQTVEMVADGDVSTSCTKAYFDAVEGAGALSGNKLLDCTRDRSTFTEDDLMTVVVRIRGRHALSVMGAVAVALTCEKSVLFARVLGAAAVADRPLRVFDEVSPARRWLNSQALRSP